MGCILAGLACRWFRLREALGRPEWTLAGAALALAAGASLGLPSLTANRDSTLLWLILGLLIVARPALVDRGVMGTSGRIDPAKPLDTL